MPPMPATRRQFLKTATATAFAGMLPARWVSAEEVTPASSLKLRFAAASDLHYGQRNTPFDEMTGDMVRWINAEKEAKGLDALFLNGDLTHDSSPMLVQLRDKHLTQLQVPYYAIKGNHDFVDETPGSPSESWQKLWGHPANHTVKLGDFVFILCDTTVAAKSNV